MVYRYSETTNLKAAMDEPIWEKKFELRLKARYKISYEITPAEGGKLTFTEAKDRSSYPQQANFKDSVTTSDDTARGNPNTEFTNFTVDSDKLGTHISIIDNVTPIFSGQSQPGEREGDMHNMSTAYNFMLFNNVPRGTGSIMKNTVDKLLNLVKGFVPGNFSLVLEKMNATLAGMSSSVILPAGNVFLLKGLNTDKDGNLYTGITYRLNSDLEKIH
jgi:hypothetical protein